MRFLGIKFGKLKMRILTIILLLFQTLNLFSQGKTIKNFEKAISLGYINSPTLIPVTIIHNDEKKYFLSDTESLYSAFEIEYNEKNIDSLKTLILKNSKNQIFNFNNSEALKVLGFQRKYTIDERELKKNRPSNKS